MLLVVSWDVVRCGVGWGCKLERCYAILIKV